MIHALMIFLDASNRYLVFLQRADPVRAGQRRSNGRHDRDFSGESSIADADFVFARNLAARRVDNESDITVFYQIDHVRSALAYLVNFFDRNLGVLE